MTSRGVGDPLTSVGGDRGPPAAALPGRHIIEHTIATAPATGNSTYSMRTYRSATAPTASAAKEIDGYCLAVSKAPNLRSTR